ncbi:MAG: MarR family winged helix-turn-helix transcriptional regulator [Paracoccaceae bacterium]
MSEQAETRRVLRTVRRIARAFDIQSRRIDRELGLTLPQYVVLTCVDDLGEVTSRAISAEAELSAPTVVGILDKLEAKGLIERYRSTRDRRIVHARLTAKGREILASAPEPLGARFAERYGKLDPMQRRAILDAVGALADVLAPEATGRPDADAADADADAADDPAQRNSTLS